MKLFNIKLLEMICPICGLHVCKCDSEQEEVEYKGKKITIGKHDDKTDHHFDPHELGMGIEDEMEHTDDEKTAKCIAKDHLSQIPDYYSKLRRMNMQRGESPKTFKEWINVK
jgi:hypothetical protein